MVFCTSLLIVFTQILKKIKLNKKYDEVTKICIELSTHSFCYWLQPRAPSRRSQTDTCCPADPYCYWLRRHHLSHHHGPYFYQPAFSSQNSQTRTRCTRRRRRPYYSSPGRPGASSCCSSPRATPPASASPSTPACTGRRTSCPRCRSSRGTPGRRLSPRRRPSAVSGVACTRPETHCLFSLISCGLSFVTSLSTTFRRDLVLGNVDDACRWRFFPVVILSMSFNIDVVVVSAAEADELFSLSLLVFDTDVVTRHEDEW